MGNNSGMSPLNPNKYLGPNVYLNIIVSRNRQPTGADYRQPETGLLYQVNTLWQVGKSPTTGVEGQIFILTKIVANVAYWSQIASSTSGIVYTNVTYAMSPYTVLITDDYISVDSSGGAVTLNFPNSPSSLQTWTVKDRTGSASVNNITLSTPGGSVTIDGQTSYTVRSNYAAVNVLANATPTYEVF